MTLLDTFKDGISRIRPQQKGRVVHDPTGSAGDYTDNSQYIPNAQYQVVDDAQEGMTYDQILAEHGVKTTTRFDNFWRAAVEIYILIMEIGLAFLMGYCNGALFAGLRPWNYSAWVDIMYLLGFAIETGAMIFLISAALSYRDGDMHKAKVLAVWAFFFCTVSLACQIGYIFLSAANNDYDLFVTAAKNLQLPIPFQFILLLRAIAPTALAVGLTFALPERKNDIDGAIKKQEKEADAVNKLDANRVRMRQLQIANNVTMHIMNSMADSVERVADAWLSGNSAILQKLEPPKMIVEDVQRPEPQPVKRQPTRAIQRQSAPQPKQPVQQPIPLAQKPQPAPQQPKYSEAEIRAYMRKVMATNTDVSVQDARKIAAQAGVDPDLVENIYHELEKETHKPQLIPVAANGNGHPQQLDRDQLTRMTTSAMPTHTPAIWEPDDKVVEVEEEDDDSSFA